MLMYVNSERVLVPMLLLYVVVVVCFSSSSHTAV